MKEKGFKYTGEQFMTYFNAEKNKLEMKDTKGNIYEVIEFRGNVVFIVCISSSNKNLIGHVRELRK